MIYKTKWNFKRNNSPETLWEKAAVEYGVGLIGKMHFPEVQFLGMLWQELFWRGIIMILIFAILPSTAATEDDFLF